MRYGSGPVKVLVCCENEIVGDAVAMSLSKAGHQSVASSDPLQLASNLSGADALVVDGKVGRRAIALLRGRDHLLPQDIYDAIVAHAREGKPEEVCGLLRGREGQVTGIHRCQNVAANLSRGPVARGKIKALHRDRGRGHEMALDLARHLQLLGQTRLDGGLGGAA